MGIEKDQFFNFSILFVKKKKNDQYELLQGHFKILFVLIHLILRYPFKIQNHSENLMSHQY